MKTPVAPIPLDIETFKDYRKRSKILIISALVAVVVVGVKALFEIINFEPLGYTSLYSTIITGGFFVLGFILSATIADYKESEKFPSDFSAIVENMYEDALGIRANYPDFDLEAFRESLINIMKCTKEDLVNVNRTARHEVHDLSDFFAQMEKAGVPPNFITKLKQEQGQLIRMLFRVYYIQSIKFIPSAFLLARMIVLSIITLLLLTNLEPTTASLGLSGIITFLTVYVLRLIKTISTPFHRRGTTKDDVSLYLIDRAIAHMEREAQDESLFST
mgnify:CR=1 FL=1